MRELTYKIVIIGAGFGGIGMAIRLQQAGELSFVVLEKAADIGGVWRDNEYPGAACDVPSHLYSFSFAPNPRWSRRYAPQSEIHDYLLSCVHEHALWPRLRLSSEVEHAVYDAESALWRITTTSGESFSAQVLITACGQLTRPAYPRIAGSERFGGELLHTARWPSGVTLAGKRVGVIGTGASAIQLVPAIVDQLDKLVVFQRSAPYLLPKLDRAYSGLEQTLFSLWPRLQTLSRASIYAEHELLGLMLVGMPKLLELARLVCDGFLRSSVPDPQLRKKLTPDYPIGCKRVLISNDYYPALQRPHAELVTESILEITERGVVTSDGVERELDTLIYGTGFLASEFLAPMRITGREGQDLNDAWRDGAEAYLGMTVHGFPNLFMLYGPNTNLGHNSIVYMLESQMRYVLSALRVLERPGVRSLDVLPHVQQRFNQTLQTQLASSVWNAGCTSWYQNEAGKQTNNWPGFTFHYRRLTHRLETRDYEVLQTP